MSKRNYIGTTWRNHQNHQVYHCMDQTGLGNSIPTDQEDTLLMLVIDKQAPIGYQQVYTITPDVANELFIQYGDEGIHGIHPGLPSVDPIGPDTGNA